MIGILCIIFSNLSVEMNQKIIKTIHSYRIYFPEILNQSYNASNVKRVQLALRLI